LLLVETKFYIFLHNISRKISLENEIIIYRHILGETEIQKTIETTVMKKRTYRETVHYQGSISIGKRQIKIEKMKQSD
jgi:hypothetical protein